MRARSTSIVPGLAIDAESPPTRGELADALAGADLVVVENLASLPLNPAARDVLYRVLDGRRALFHHHDLPWQRAHLAHFDGPRDCAVVVATSRSTSCRAVS